MSGKNIKGILDILGSETIEYKGKKYRIWKIKEEQRIIPVGEKHNNDEKSRKKEVIFKDYKVGKWNVTVNANGETIIVGWGPLKHLTIWGSIIFLLIIVAYYFIRRLRRAQETEWERNSKKAKNRGVDNK